MGYITNLSSNRTPPQSKLVMKHMVSMQVLYRGGGITLGPHDSNRFMINVYAFIIVVEEVYHTVWLYRGSDGKFKPNGSCYKDNDGYRLHLHTQWHSDGTASYEHIYLQPDGYTIEANWVE